MAEHGGDGRCVAADVGHHFAGGVAKAMEGEAGANPALCRELSNELKKARLESVLSEWPAARADDNLGAAISRSRIEDLAKPPMCRDPDWSASLALPRLERLPVIGCPGDADDIALA